MSTLFTRVFWEDTTERALKSGAQAAILALGGDAFNAWSIDWMDVSGITLGGAALSLLTSIASAGIANRGTASLVKSVKPVEPTDEAS
jgi:hypothetical protein